MYAVIRLRGNVEMRKDVAYTLKLLNLNSANSCVLLPETGEVKGMLSKVKDKVTWGEVPKEVVISLMKSRMKAKSGKKIEEKDLKGYTGFDSFDKIVEEIAAGKAGIRKFDKVQPNFRLSPPSGGFKSVRHAYPSGDNGYRGKEIVSLIERMM